MDFLITRTPFLGRRVPKYPVNTDKVTQTGDLACGRQVVYGYIRYSDVRGTSTLAAVTGDVGLLSLGPLSSLQYTCK